MKKVQSLMGVNELCDVELNKVFTEGGAFFIDGYLNQQYYCGPKKIKIQTSSTGKADRQRHSTAVVEYMVHDHPAFILGGSMSAANLWLDARATPNRKKGFMREFLRVYKVFKCTSKRKDTCKGNCCPVKKARRVCAKRVRRAEEVCAGVLAWWDRDVSVHTHTVSSCDGGCVERGRCFRVRLSMRLVGAAFWCVVHSALLSVRMRCKIHTLSLLFVVLLSLSLSVCGGFTESSVHSRRHSTAPAKNTTHEAVGVTTHQITISPEHFPTQSSDGLMSNVN
eukprot:7385607-Prymnesium_polylepis.2